MRFVGQQHNSENVLLYLRWAASRSLLISSLMLVILWCGRYWLGGLFDSVNLSALLWGMALAVPAYSFSYLLSGVFKGIRMPATACLLENGSIALITGLFILIWAALKGNSQPIIIGFALALAAWLVALHGALRLWIWCRQQSWWVSRHEYWLDKATLREFRASSRAFLLLIWRPFAAGSGSTSGRLFVE